jgi:hypothetical protein
VSTWTRARANTKARSTSTIASTTRTIQLAGEVNRAPGISAYAGLFGIDEDLDGLAANEFGEAGIVDSGVDRAADRALQQDGGGGRVVAAASRAMLRVDDRGNGAGGERAVALNVGRPRRVRVLDNRPHGKSDRQAAEQQRPHREPDGPVAPSTAAQHANARPRHGLVPGFEVLDHRVVAPEAVLHRDRPPNARND